MRPSQPSAESPLFWHLLLALSFFAVFWNHSCIYSGFVPFPLPLLKVGGLGHGITTPLELCFILETIQAAGIKRYEMKMQHKHKRMLTLHFIALNSRQDICTTVHYGET